MKFPLLTNIVLWLSAAAVVSCTTTRTPSALVYKVTLQKGESLAEIAARYDTTWQHIADDNHINDLSQIRAGMQLMVRPGPGGFVVGTPLNDVGANGSRQTTGKAEKKRGLLFGDGEPSAAVYRWPVLSRRITFAFW